MENIQIKISKETREVEKVKSYIGNDGENLQGTLEFSFLDEFVNGTGRIEYQIGDNKYYDMLTKVGETYIIPIKNVITKEGKILMQLVITEGTQDQEIPIFKSKIFKLSVKGSINAQIEQPDEYPTWIEIANTKLNQMDNLDIDMVTEDDETKVVITRKDGTTKEAVVSGGGGISDVKVNNTSVVTNNVANVMLKTINNQSITGAGNIEIGGGSGDVADVYYDDASVLDNNKIAQLYSEVHVGNTAPTKSQKLWLDTSEDDVALKDLQDDSTHRLVTDADISNWNSKGTYSKPSGGIPATDLASAVQTSLGKADTALQTEQYTGTITGITINGASKGTSGVVDLGTVVTDKSDKQDTLVSGTNIKTINNESILGSGNITIQGGGTTYTAGANIQINNGVISATDTTYTDATTNTSGLMSATDKTKLDGVDTSLYALKSIYGDNKISLGRRTNVGAGSYSSAVGNNVGAYGNYSHAEGSDTYSSGESSHAEGWKTSANGKYSHSEGNHTIANRQSQHVFGEYNIKDTSGSYNGKGTYIEVVGNGTSATYTMTFTGDGETSSFSFRNQDPYPDEILSVSYSDNGNYTYTRDDYILMFTPALANGTVATLSYSVESRSNARTLDWSGNEVLAGSLTINGNQSVETTSNKVTSLSSSSTDTEYPSAKCVYDLVGDIETLLGGI